MTPSWHHALGFVSPKGLQVNSLSCSRAEQGMGASFTSFGFRVPGPGSLTFPTLQSRGALDS